MQCGFSFGLLRTDTSSSSTFTGQIPFSAREGAFQTTVLNTSLPGTAYINAPAIFFIKTLSSLPL